MANVDQQSKYRPHVSVVAGIGGVHIASCHHCDFRWRSQGGNALARAAKVRGAVQAHVREFHAAELEQSQRRARIRQLESGSATVSVRISLEELEALVRPDDASDDVVVRARRKLGHARQKLNDELRTIRDLGER